MDRWGRSAETFMVVSESCAALSRFDVGSCTRLSKYDRIKRENSCGRSCWFHLQTNQSKDQRGGMSNGTLVLAALLAAMLLSGVCDAHITYREVPNAFMEQSTVLSDASSYMRRAIPAAADFNNDGLLDYVETNYKGLNLLRIQVAPGEFEEYSLPNQDASHSTMSASTSDVDSDGLVDILFVNSYDGLQLLRNQGNLSFVDVSAASGIAPRCSYFSELWQLTEGPHCHSMRAEWGDLDLDGDDDLLVTNAGESCTIFLNNGNGSLTYTYIPSLSGEIANFKSAKFRDFDGDGDLDIFMTAFFSAQFLLRNDDPSSLAFTRVLDNDLARANGFFSDSLFADFNGDGFLDAFLPSEVGGSSLYAGGPNCTFRVLASDGIMTGDTSVFSEHAIALDYDSDGDLDVLVGGLHGNNALYENEGSFRFTTTTHEITRHHVDTIYILPGDFDGNGHDDLLFVSSPPAVHYIRFPIVPFENVLVLKFGENEYRATSNNRLTGVLPWVTRMGVADFDNDGVDEILLARYGDRTAVYSNNMLYTRSTVTAGDQRYRESIVGVSTTRTTSISIGDVDQDGYMDAVIGTWEGEETILLKNVGGTLVATTMNISNVAATRDVLLCDLDADGDLDLLVLNYLDKSEVYANHGNWTFEQMTPHILELSKMSGGSSATCADVDNDGSVDVFVTTAKMSAPTTNLMFYNRGDWEFTQSLDCPTVLDAATSMSALFEDFDSDGDLDLLVTNLVNQRNLLYFNGFPGPFYKAQVSAATEHADSCMDATFTDSNLDGKLDVVLLHVHMTPENFFNDGMGVFTKLHYIATASNMSDALLTAIEVIDYDMDGDDDLVIGSATFLPAAYGTTAGVFLLENIHERELLVPLETSGFSFQSTSFVQDEVWIDLNGDGVDDLLFGQGDLYLSKAYPNVAYVHEVESGAFVRRDLPEELEQGGASTNGLYAIDFDHDGDTDIYSVTGGFNKQVNNTLFRNEGDGIFVPVLDHPLSAISQLCVSALWEDFSGDGKIDVIVLRSLEHGPLVMINDGHGGFVESPVDVGGLSGAFWAGGCASDVDEDGDIDVYFVLMFGSPNVYFENMGNGTFVPHVYTSEITSDPFSSSGCVFVDFDDDGRDDLFITSLNLQFDLDTTQERNRMFRNLGQNQWEEVFRPVLESAAASNSVEVMDVNGDNRDDILIANGESVTLKPARNSLLLRNGTGSFTMEGSWHIVSGLEVTTSFAKSSSNRLFEPELLAVGKASSTSTVYFLDTCHQNRTSPCQLCPPGFYGAYGRCLPCTKGTYSQSYLQTSCTQCTAGKSYQSEMGQTDCKLCPRGTFTNMDGAYSVGQCRPCPVGSDLNAFSVEGDACPCLANFYRPRTFGECFACPQNGVARCVDGNVEPSPGHWWNTSRPFGADGSTPAIYKCPFTAACPGGASGSCVEGYAGKACAQCDEGYFLVYGVCSECLSPGLSLFVAFVVWGAVVFVVVLVFRVNFIVALREHVKCFSGGRLGESLKDRRRKTEMVTTSILKVTSALSMVKVVISYYQESTSLLNSFTGALPLEYARVAEKFDFVNLDIFGLISPDCFGFGWELDYIDVFLGMVMLSPIATVLLCLWYVLYANRQSSRTRKKVRGSTQEEVRRALLVSDLEESMWSNKDHRRLIVRNAMIRNIVFVLYVLYIPLNVKIFNMFRCTTVDDESVLEVDYSISCKSSRYLAVRTFAVVLAVVHSVGLPLALAALLFRSRSGLRRSVSELNSAWHELERAESKRRKEEAEERSAALVARHGKQSAQSSQRRRSSIFASLQRRKSAILQDLRPKLAALFHRRKSECPTELSPRPAPGLPAPSPSLTNLSVVTREEVEKPRPPTRILVRPSKGSVLNVKAMAVKEKELRVSATVRLGFLVENYRSQHYYWELVEICRKFFMSCIILFSGSTDEQRILVAIIISAVSLMLYFACKPFMSKVDGFVHSVGLVCTFLKLWIVNGLLLDVLNDTETVIVALGAINLVIAATATVLIAMYIWTRIKQRVVGILSEIAAEDAVDEQRTPNGGESTRKISISVDHGDSDSESSIQVQANVEERSPSSDATGECISPTSLSENHCGMQNGGIEVPSIVVRCDSEDDIVHDDNDEGMEFSIQIPPPIEDSERTDAAVMGAPDGTIQNKPSDTSVSPASTSRPDGDESESKPSTPSADTPSTVGRRGRTASRVVRKFFQGLLSADMVKEVTENQLGNL